jgi:hypothetical protein
LELVKNLYLKNERNVKTLKKIIISCNLENIWSQDFAKKKLLEIIEQLVNKELMKSLSVISSNDIIDKLKQTEPEYVNILFDEIIKTGNLDSVKQQGLQKKCMDLVLNVKLT